MTIRYTVALVILIFLNAKSGQANEGGCTAQEHGEFLPLGSSTASIIKVVEGRAGKAGPPGPPGPGPIVNKIDIDEEIETKFREAKRGLDEKLEAMEKRLETAESKMKEVKRGLDEKLEAMEKRLKTAELKMRGYVSPTGCDKVDKLDAKQWNQTGGLFDIYPTQDEEAMEVYCDITTDGGRWTVFQRRMDGSEDFYRGWNDYVNGFGEKDKEFWLGLEAIHQMTKGGNYELRADMMDWEGNTAYAKYSTFTVGDGASKYRLNVSGYSGNAGDSLAYHNGYQFTTIDSGGAHRYCAVDYKGAWWYNACHHSNLNGLYVEGGRPVAFGQGIGWYHWKGHVYALKFTEMKLRKKQ